MTIAAATGVTAEAQIYTGVASNIISSDDSQPPEYAANSSPAATKPST